MGCGASSNAVSPTPIVFTAPPILVQGVPPPHSMQPLQQQQIDPTKSRKVHVGLPAQRAQAQPNMFIVHNNNTADGSHTDVNLNALPPGLASFKNSPAGVVISSQNTAGGGVASLRSTNGDSLLPPLKTTPNGSTHSLLDGSNSGFNFCNADYFPTHMEQVWQHYSHQPDQKVIDKNGVKQMAEDCVASFLDAARKWIQTDNPKWDKTKVDTKLNLMRGQYLPGSKVEDTVSIATHFLAHELKFSSDASTSGITKPCFFLHFQRAHRLLFSFTPGGGSNSITLERELLVQKLNKQGVERANKGMKSMTAKSAAANAKEVSISSTASQKGAKSVKAAKKKSKTGGGTSTSKQSSTGGNMFGQLDFSGPPQSINQQQTIQEADY